MKLYRSFSFLHNACCILAGVVLLAGCKVGEDDPAISLRSRDNRIKANWKMTSMENRFEFRTFQAGAVPVTTIITSRFDGYSMHVQTTVNNNQVADTAFGLNYVLKIKDDGELLYESTFIQGGFGVKVPGEEAWYWLNNDSKKARVALGNALQAPMAAGIRTIPGGLNLGLTGLAQDFQVDGLRKKELDLSYDKTTNQAGLDGSFQQVIISSKMEFTSK